MNKYKLNPLTDNEIKEWFKNKSCNPRTKRKIKDTGKVWKLFHKTYYTKTLPKDNYENHRKRPLDPILGVELPIIKKKKYFKFSFFWDPYSGIRESIDPRGSLCFDPDSLIYYFYTNRLNHLWTPTTSEYTGHYGDGVGNGPDFHIPGRGFHNDWYLFRLPIQDGYIKKSEWCQIVTMGPILTFEEIEKIYNLGLEYKTSFKERFNINRPNLMEIYKLYNIAISKHPILNISSELDQNLDPETRMELEMIENRNAVNKLKKI